MRPFGLYVHIPYCSKKCPYCDFNTYAVGVVPEREYVDALIFELNSFGENPLFNGREIRSIFFGGGTPSILSSASIARVIDAATRIFPMAPRREISLEANPMTAADDYFAELRSVGVNRVSLGAQTFSEEFLQALGREHTPALIENAVASVVRSGIENVSIDVMHGLPGQKREDLEYDLRAAVSLPITHLSSYGLTIEKGTPFYQRQERGLLTLPEENVQVELLESLHLFMKKSGFQHYEISNFCRPGFECVHNIGYWDGADYLGLGAGAHSFALLPEASATAHRVRASRWCNRANPGDYMKAVHSGAVKAWEETLVQQDLEFEFFFLGLRRLEGVSFEAFERAFGEEQSAPYREKALELSRQGLLAERGDKVFLTERGVLLADSVVAEFALGKV